MEVSLTSHVNAFLGNKYTVTAIYIPLEMQRQLLLEILLRNCNETEEQRFLEGYLEPTQTSTINHF